MVEMKKSAVPETSAAARVQSGVDRASRTRGATGDGCAARTCGAAAGGRATTGSRAARRAAVPAGSTAAAEQAKGCCHQGQGQTSLAAAHHREIPFHGCILADASDHYCVEFLP